MQDAPELSGRSSSCRNLCLVCLGKTLLTALPEEQPKRNTVQEGQDQGIPEAHTSVSGSRSSSGSQRDASPLWPTGTSRVWGRAPALLPCWDVLLGLQRSAWAVGTGWLWLDVGSPSLGSCQHHGVSVPSASWVRACGRALMGGCSNTDGRSYQAPKSAQNGKQRPCSLLFIPGVLLNT